MYKSRIVCTVAAVVVAASASPAAFAGDKPSDDQYPSAPVLMQKTPQKPKSTPTQPSGVAGAPASQATAPETTAKPSGTLPFTGLDLAFVAAAGCAAVAGGVGLRKVGRKRTGA
jgi:hypothetical protein